VAVVHQNFAGHFHEAPAGDAHAKEAAEKSLLESGIVFEGVHDGPHFLFRLRTGNAPDAIEIAPEEARAQPVDEKRDGLYFRMYRIPEKAFFERFLGVFESRAKGGFEVVSGVHGELRQVRALQFTTIVSEGMPPRDRRRHARL
jgi:hypothetical protein